MFNRKRYATSATRHPAQLSMKDAFKAIDIFELSGITMNTFKVIVLEIKCQMQFSRRF